MEADANFVEFIGLLNARGVKYLVVGGFAVNYHGYPRFTGDIDLWLWLDPTNLERVVQSLRDFGFGGLGIGVEQLNAPYKVIQLGYEPHRIDLMTTVDGVDFEACYARASTVELDTANAPFISMADLIAAKEATGRPKDIADAAELRKLL